MAKRPPSLRDWYGEDGSDRICGGQALPQAKSHLLAAADAAILDVATSPYVGTGHAFKGGTTGLTDRYFGAVLAPGARHCRLALTLCPGPATGGAVVSAIQWYTSTGGTTGNDVCLVQPPVLLEPTYPTATVAQPAVIVLSPAEIDDAPASTIERYRQGELTQQRSPYLEAMYASYVCGVSVYVSEQSEDLQVI